MSNFTAYSDTSTCIERMYESARFVSAACLKSISASRSLNLIKTIVDVYSSSKQCSLEKFARRIIEAAAQILACSCPGSRSARQTFVPGRVDFSVRLCFRYTLEKLVNSSSIDGGAREREREREREMKRREGFVVLARAAVARSIGADSTCTGLVLMQLLPVYIFVAHLASKIR